LLDSACLKGEFIVTLLFAVGITLLVIESHAHPHHHDDWHHTHDHHGLDREAGHTHWHDHDPVTHAHVHWPDLHHRHAHDA
jgi:hypothetical protein